METVLIYNGASVLGWNRTWDLLAPGLHVTLLPRVAMGWQKHLLTRKSPEALEGEGLYV